MQFNIPKNTDKYYWTKHSIFKMQQYGLTAQRIVRVINSPKRTQIGVAKNTIAVMQPTSLRRGKDGKKTWSSEVWTMYQIRKKGNLKPGTVNLGQFQTPMSQQIRIISAWRYPGISPKDDPIPEDIMQELEDIL